MNTFEQMIDRGHEWVSFHCDPETGLRAIIAVHSTVLGNALGGTRRWHYATEADALHDVLRLAEGMTYKAACAGLAMGGAKSVIWTRRPDHPASEGEARAMGRFVETLGGTYIAAEDVGVDIQFIDWMALETGHVMGGDPSPCTAQGVIHGMRACLAHLGLPVSFDGLTVAVQGLGSVGHKVAKIVSEDGASVIGADTNEEKVERAVEELGITAVPIDEVLLSQCDILAPCALGGVIDANLAQHLHCSVICGGANNVLGDPDEDAVALKNRGILYAPDFVVNAGGLIERAGLYLGMTRDELDRKNADIESTTIQILQKAETTLSTHAAAIAVARQRIADGAKERVHAG